MHVVSSELAGTDHIKKIMPITLECNNGDLRLVNGSSPLEGNVDSSSPLEGNVEICFNNTFGAICDDFWDERAAMVVCSLLGFDNGNGGPVPSSV